MKDERRVRVERRKGGKENKKTMRGRKNGREREGRVRN